MYTDSFQAQGYFIYTQLNLIYVVYNTSVYILYIVKHTFKLFCLEYTMLSHSSVEV